MARINLKAIWKKVPKKYPSGNKIPHKMRMKMVGKLMKVHSSKRSSRVIVNRKTRTHKKRSSGTMVKRR